MRRFWFRLAYLVALLILASLAVFVVVRVLRGDVAASRSFASPQQRRQFDEFFGLDRPLYAQYLKFIGEVVTGDLGVSMANGQPVLSMIRFAGRNTLVLAGSALILVIVVGVPLGVLAALRHDRPADRVILTTSAVGFAMPHFWLALLSVWLFASVLGWLPSAGCCTVPHLVMPALVLSLEGISLTSRMTRAAMLDNLGREYVKTLRAGGLPEWRIVAHVLRNSLVPIISIVGIRVGQLVGSAVVVEVVFGWPGVGWALVNGILKRDLPVVQDFSLLLVATVIISNWLADIAYGAANPRLRR